MSDIFVSLFNYPTKPHDRRHGPSGYTDYRSYKPWLRDEFEFRCVFCLVRERWSPEGDSGFSVEHIVPQSKNEDLICEYHNLLLACVGCNSIKSDSELGLDPCQVAFGLHIRFDADGRLEALTPEGNALIQLCLLNRPKLVETRKRYQKLCEFLLAQKEDPLARDLIRQTFGYPENLPNLSKMIPPGGNTQPGGLGTCHHARKAQGKLNISY